MHRHNLKSVHQGLSTFHQSYTNVILGGHDVSGWYLAEICVWLMQCAKILNQICRPRSEVARRRCQPRRKKYVLRPITFLLSSLRHVRCHGLIWHWFGCVWLVLEKVTDLLFEKRLKQFGIGSAFPPKKDLHRFVKWPKVVRIQRQRRILMQHLEVLLPLNQVLGTLDKNLGIHITTPSLPSLNWT